MCFKQELLKETYKNIEQQESSLKMEIESVREDMSQETKSSAGDKFETSREMMSQEKSRLQERLGNLQSRKRSIREALDTKSEESVSFGSLVDCDGTLFLIGISLGKIDFKGKSVMAVSLNSPIGKAFYQKKINEVVSFMSNNYTIKSIS